MSAGMNRGLPGAKASWRAGLVAGVALLACCPAALASTRSTAAYVVDSGDSTIVQYTVLSTGALVPDSPANVPTGENPSALALSRDGKSAYVTNELSSTVGPTYQANISQYNVGANGHLTPKVPATVQTGYIPVDVATSPDGKSVYVLCQDGSYNPATGTQSPNQIYQYNVAADGSLSPKSPAYVNVSIGQPQGIVVSPDGSSVYVVAGHDANPSDYAAPGSVIEFSVATNGTLTRKAAIATGPVPVGIAVNPNGQTVYVVNSDFGSYDHGTGSISQYVVGASGALTPDVPASVATGTNIYDPNSFPDYIAMSPNGTNALILTGGSPPQGRLNYTIAANGTLSPGPASLTAPTFPLDAGTPIAAAYNADGVHGYITDQGGGFVAGSGYNIGSDGPPVVESFTGLSGAGPTQNTPSEFLTHPPFEGSPFPFEIVLNNQPAFEGTAF